MAIYVNQKEAEQQFNQLFEQVLKGEEIIISVEGKEMARLLPSCDRVTVSSQNIAARIPGIDEGRFVVPDDFDEPLPPDILKAFEGEN